MSQGLPRAIISMSSEEYYREDKKMAVSFGGSVKERNRGRLAAKAAVLLSGLVISSSLMAGAASPARAQLAQVGPTADNGFPAWYQDELGVQMAPCIEDLELCAIEEAPAPGALPAEIPYWSAEAGMPVGSGEARLVLALEGADDGGPITSGGIIITANGLQPGASYKITHPYGIENAVADEDGRIRIVDEAGCDIEPGEECDFSQALQTRIGPFLAWNPAMGETAPDGFLGDPEIPHQVVGSPNDTNFFKIEGENAGAGSNVAETDLFSVVGQVEGLAAFPSLRGGQFEQPQSVVLGSSDSEASVFYTTDGSDPVTSDTRTQYNAGQEIPINQTSTLSFVVINGNEQSPVFSERYVIQPPTALEMSAGSSVIEYRQATNLSGQLTSGGAGLADKPVILEHRPAGAADWSQLGEAQNTDANGNYSFANVKPDKNTSYRVSFAGEAESYQASASAAKRVNVKAKVGLGAATTDLKLGRSRNVAGSVAPSHAGEVVKLTIKRNGAAVLTRNLRLSETSRYSFSYTPKQLGRYSVQASFARDADHLGNTSLVKSFRVIR